MREAAARKEPIADIASSAVIGSAEFQPRQLGATARDELEIQPLALQPAFRPRASGRYHVSELTKYHDRNFIQNAYQAILKRSPDAVGFKSFLDSLHTARLNKIDILARLRYSPEGRAKNVEISGLQAPAIIRKAYRLPVIGYLANLAVALLRLPNSVRGQQRFEAHVLAQQEIIVEHFNHVARSIRDRMHDLGQANRKQVESIAAVGNQLGIHQQEIESLKLEHEQLLQQQAARVSVLSQQMQNNAETAEQLRRNLINSDQ